MTIKVYENDFNPWQEIQRYQCNLLVEGSYGATTIFIGTMRDFNEGDGVKCMNLEYYPGMTEKYLAKILSEAKQNWRIIRALIVHRVGMILPDQPIVLIAVWAAHRGDAFDANRYIIEALKSKVPFWKKEVLTTEQDRWVIKNTDGYC